MGKNEDRIKRKKKRKNRERRKDELEVSDSNSTSTVQITKVDSCVRFSFDVSQICLLFPFKSISNVFSTSCSCLPSEGCNP